MTIPSEHAIIHRFHSLNGKSATIEQIRQLLKATQDELDADGHGPHATALRDVHQRLTSGLKKMITGNIYEVEKINVKPVAGKKPVKKKVKKKLGTLPPEGIVVGKISTNQAKAIGDKAGDILLMEGNDKFGVKHIQSRHPEIKNPVEFVKEVCKNFDSIGIDRNDKKSGKYWLIKKSELNQICVVEFGLIRQHYTVTTAFKMREMREKIKELFSIDPSTNNPSPSLGSALQRTKNKEGFRRSGVTCRKSSFTTKLGKSLTKIKLTGVVSAASLKDVTFHPIPLSGAWKKIFCKLHSDTQVMVWGMPGSGKSVMLLLFAQAMAAAGQKVLYIANEEFGRSTFAEKLRDFHIEHSHLKFCQHIDESIFPKFDIVFFDSVNSTGLTLDNYRKMREKWADKCFVLIVQATKDGDFRGGKDWEHEVDVAGEVANRKLILRKHRLDPDNAKKAEQLRSQEQIKEAGHRAHIKEAIKKQILNKKQHV